MFKTRSDGFNEMEELKPFLVNLSIIPSSKATGISPYIQSKVSVGGPNSIYVRIIRFMERFPYEMRGADNTRVKS